jgi:hypothetical protein
MSRSAVRGFSAPPEVVVNTATDPARQSAWLPQGTGVTLDKAKGEVLEVRLDGTRTRGVLHVRPADAGGCSVELVVTRGPSPEEVLWDLAREVQDNFNAG